MPLVIPAILALAATCAPLASSQTMAAVALAESGGDPLAIGVNGAKPYALHPRDAAEAEATAERLMAKGSNFDLGIAQINSRNLASLGLSVEGAFDACRNLEASSRVLAAGYRASGPESGEQAALRRALSLYNTGSKTRGFTNGYVEKVTASARRIVPSLEVTADGANPPASPAPELAPPPSWDVFAATSPAKGFVIQPQTQGDGQ